MVLAPDADITDLTDGQTLDGATLEDLGDALLLRFGRHVSSAVAAASTTAVARHLLRRGAPMVVIADLSLVETFDLSAPIAAVREAGGIVSLIDRVEIIAQRRVVRIAAVSAARILGLRCVARLRATEH